MEVMLRRWQTPRRPLQADSRSCCLPWRHSALTPSTCNLASSSWTIRAGVLYSLNLDCIEKVLTSSAEWDGHFTSYRHCLWNGDIVARQELEKVGQGELLVHTASRRPSKAQACDLFSLQLKAPVAVHNNIKLANPCIGIATVLLSTCPLLRPIYLTRRTANLTCPGRWSLR